MKKLGIRNLAAGSRGKEAAIEDSLFPGAPVTNWDLAPSPAVPNIFQVFDHIWNYLEFPVPSRSSRKQNSVEPSGDLHRVAAGPSGIPALAWLMPNIGTNISQRKGKLLGSVLDS